jgi:predicted DNA-binding transcriptional regulator AlpA
MPYPEIITRAQMAKSLSVSETSVDRLAEAGKLQKIQITPNRVGFLRSELDRFIADNARSVVGVAI